jgi:hypothetical protein
MSTFQPAMSSGGIFGLFGTGNLSQPISKSNQNQKPSFLGDILARLPDAMRETFREPHIYAPHRDSVNHFMEIVEDVGAGECEVDLESYHKFLIAADTAIKLLLSRPMSVPLPEIDVRQNGKIEFEWYQNPRKLVSFTIDQNGRLVYSALIDGEKIGKAFLQSEWVPEVVTTIKRVMA